MIFAHGTILPDEALPALLTGLEEEINETRATKTITAPQVVNAIDTLGRRLAAGEFDALLAQYLPAGQDLGEIMPLLRRETLEQKLAVELGAEPGGNARRLPLGTLLHITAGNMPALSVFSAAEGLLTGNVNLIKLPRGDKGLSLAALKLLTDTDPALAPFLYAFDLPSTRRPELQALASLADGVAVWGGDEAVRAARELASPGTKLMEWAHRLSFAYISGFEDREQELTALAHHIIETGQRLCSSCQVIFLDTDDFGEVTAFAKAFLPYLEAAASQRTGPGAGAQAALSGYTALLERVVHGRAAGEALFHGRGCSVTARPDGELELSPMEGNVFVKPLPRRQLLPTLRRQKERLQTAGLICPSHEREELTTLLARAGLTRITRAGSLSALLPGEAHDGEYPLRRYTRIVDVEA